jgi:hypothetical protein
MSAADCRTLTDLIGIGAAVARRPHATPPCVRVRTRRFEMLRQQSSNNEGRPSDTKLSYPSVRFVVFYTSHRLRLVSPVKQLFPDDWPVLFEKVLQSGDGPHDARTTFIGLHLPLCCLQVFRSHTASINRFVLAGFAVPFVVWMGSAKSRFSLSTSARCGRSDRAHCSTVAEAIRLLLPFFQRIQI